MKTYYVPLTSEQLAPNLPNVLDHWFILDRDPNSNLLTGYFPYPSITDDGVFLSLYVSGAGTADVNGVYYFRDNHYFYQDTPANGYYVDLSGSNWVISDTNNNIQYSTPYSNFYSLNNSWSARAGAVPSPTVTITAYPATYDAFVSGGNIFPWGYQVVDQTQSATINGDLGLKGDTTIVFVPSGIDITYHDILKIVYNPDNGEDVLTINRPILPSLTDQSFSGFLIGNQFDSPIYKNVGFTYRASSYPVTYHPSITALYGDMTRLFYSYTLTIHPNSIYDVDGVHILAINQIPAASGSSVSLMAIESRDSIVSNIITPSK